MNRYFVIFALIALAVPGASVVAQEKEEAVPLEQESIETLEAVLNDAKITIYADDNYKGKSQTLWLKTGARIDLKDCLNDKTSSFRLTAPIGTSVTVYEKYNCYGCKTYSGTWWGRGAEYGVGKEKLQYLGVHDNITRIYFLVDGFLPNSGIQRPSC